MLLGEEPLRGVFPEQLVPEAHYLFPVWGFHHRVNHGTQFSGMGVADPLTADILIAGKKLPSLDLLSTITAQR